MRRPSVETTVTKFSPAMLDAAHPPSIACRSSIWTPQGSFPAGYPGWVAKRPYVWLGLSMHANPKWFVAWVVFVAATGKCCYRPLFVNGWSRVGSDLGSV